MDTVTIRRLLVTAALTAAFPLAVLAAPSASPELEERLGSAVRALPAPQQAQIRAAMRQSAVAPDQHAVTGQLRPNTFAAMRARLVRPRDTATADPTIPRRYVRNLDAICRTMPAAARLGAGLSDAQCAQVHASAAAAPS
jgi:hypothetical protein